MSTPEVGTSLSRAEAQAQGKVPHGHAWDEETQQPVPFGQVRAVTRLEEPLDLEKRLDEYDRNRSAVMKFVATRMRESEYDNRGLPVAGAMHDFYTVPGGAQKTLTKLGAEHLGGLFRYYAGEITIQSSECRADFVEITVSQIIVDHLGRIVGSAASSCSSAESAFQTVYAKKKYGGRYRKNGRELEWVVEPDFRAARNDITARARKRAYVQSMIVATATDEIFSHVTEIQDEDARRREERTTGLPDRMPSGEKAGQRLVDLTSDYLARVREWCLQKGTHLELVEAIELVLEDRRETTPVGEGDPSARGASDTAPAPASEQPKSGRPKRGFVPFGEHKDTLELADCSDKHLRSISKWCTKHDKFLEWRDDCDSILAQRAEAKTDDDGRALSLRERRALRDREIEELELSLGEAGISPHGPTDEIRQDRARLRKLLADRAADQVNRP